VKLLAFSDAHARPAAVSAALRLGRELGAEELVCLGDVVGYGDEPRETIERLRESGAVVLRGNHDAAIEDDEVLATFSEDAAEGIRRHRLELDVEEKSWLATLPLEHRVGSLRFAHASLPAPERFRYLTLARWEAKSEPETYVHVAEVAAALAPGETLFVGHSHRPRLWDERKGGWRARMPDQPTYSLPVAHRRMVVEVGSIADPRRGRPTAVLVDLEARVLSVHRLTK